MRYTIRFCFRIVDQVAIRSCYDFAISEESRAPGEEWNVSEGLHKQWLHIVVAIPDGEDPQDYIEENLTKYADDLAKRHFSKLEQMGDWEPNPKWIS